MSYIPELEELPEISSADVGTLRSRDTILKRMPSIQDLSLERYYAPGSRAEEAAQYAADVGAAFDISRKYAQASRAIHRAKELAKTRLLRQIEQQVPRTARQLVIGQNQARARFVRDVARSLGLGTDLYR